MTADPTAHADTDDQELSQEPSLSQPLSAGSVPAAETPMVDVGDDPDGATDGATGDDPDGATGDDAAVDTDDGDTSDRAEHTGSGSAPGQDTDDSATDSPEQAAVAGAPGAASAAGRAGRRGGRTALLEREGEVAADFLERLLDIADLDGDIDVDVDGDRAIVAIVDSEEGRVPRRLVGQDAVVLEALQELTRLAVQAATGERSRLMLDVAGHRAARRAELEKMTQEAVETVRSTGESANMPHMTAFERKVVHDAVLAGGLRSESEGVDPHRYVVVLPAG